MATKNKLNEYLTIRRKFRLTAIAAIAVLSTGTIFYHGTENLRWLDSLYFSTITLTTIGYGDIFPKTDAGKIFTIFYVLIGIGILATFANLFIQNAVAKREIKRLDKSETENKT